MKIENENQMIVIDDEGKERLVEILFTYENEDRETFYVFFYEPEDPEQEVTVMRYYDNGELEGIDDDEEYEEVLEVFNAWQEDFNIQEGN